MAARYSKNCEQLQTQKFTPAIALLKNPAESVPIRPQKTSRSFWLAHPDLKQNRFLKEFRRACGLAVKECHPCQVISQQPIKYEPLRMTEIPAKCWQTVVMDYRSRYPVVIPMRVITAEKIIKELRTVLVIVDCQKVWLLTMVHSLFQLIFCGICRTMRFVTEELLQSGLKQMGR